MKFYIIYLTFYISPAKQVASQDGTRITQPFVIEILSWIHLGFLNCEGLNQVLPEGVGAVTNHLEGAKSVDPFLEVTVDVDLSVVCTSRPC